MLRQFNRQDLLGKRLVEKGVITEEQLAEALRLQDELSGDKNGSRGMLGKLLVELGYCTEEDVAKVLARTSQCPVYFFGGLPDQSGSHGHHFSRGCPALQSPAH